MKKIFAWLLFISLLLVGCSLPKDSENTVNVLSDWTKREFADYNATLNINNWNYWISTGCNNIGWSFTMNESEFSFWSALSTKMFCSADIQKTETELSKFISNVTDFSISWDELTLIWNDKELVLNKVISE